MSYADYEFYTKEYHGSKASEDLFENLSIRASKVVDKVTFDRADDSRDVKLATCAVVDVIVMFEEREGIAAETTGNHTVSYGSSSQSNSRSGDTSLMKRMVDAAREYLPDELLYRGV